MQTGASNPAPLAVLMISFNEAHNIEEVLDNLDGFASEIFLVDSFSSDETVDIAIKSGVHVVQRAFRGFGDQWNFAVNSLPVKSPWTMKLDPDERLTDELKTSIRSALAANEADGFILTRRLWFMARALHVRQPILRIWRTGTCRFSDVTVNEHPIVQGRIAILRGDLEHHDSPQLHHWLDKQNRYTTAEALSAFSDSRLAGAARLFGSPFERRMWLKKHFWSIPFRYTLLFLYHLFVTGAWKAGRAGLEWAHLRTEIYRMIELKKSELKRLPRPYDLPAMACGTPHPGARQVRD